MPTLYHDVMEQYWLYVILYFIPPKWPFNIMWAATYVLRAGVGLYRPHSSYVINVLIGLDQLANATAGGDPRETISSRAAKARAAGQPWGCWLCKVLGAIAIATWLRGQPVDHCAQSLNPEVGSDAVIPDQ